MPPPEEKEFPAAYNYFIVAPSGRGWVKMKEKEFFSAVSAEERPDRAEEPLPGAVFCLFLERLFAQH